MRGFMLLRGRLPPIVDASAPTAVRRAILPP